MVRPCRRVHKFAMVVALRIGPATLSRPLVRSHCRGDELCPAPRGVRPNRSSPGGINPHLALRGEANQYVLGGYCLDHGIGPAMSLDGRDRDAHSCTRPSDFSWVGNMQIGLIDYTAKRLALM